MRQIKLPAESLYEDEWVNPQCVKSLQECLAQSTCPIWWAIIILGRIGEERKLFCHCPYSKSLSFVPRGTQFGPQKGLLIIPDRYCIHPKTIREHGKRHVYWQLLLIMSWPGASTHPPLHTHVCTYYCCCSVPKLCLTLCGPMECSTPGFPALHHLLEFAQTQVHWVSDAFQSSRPLLSPSPPPLNLSQHQGLF